MRGCWTLVFLAVAACGVDSQGPENASGSRAVGEPTGESCDVQVRRAWCDGDLTLKWCEEGRVYQAHAIDGWACLDLQIGSALLPLDPQEGPMIDCNNPCDLVFHSDNPYGTCDDGGRLLWCDQGAACAAVCARGSTCRWDQYRYDCALPPLEPPSSGDQVDGCCGLDGVCGCDGDLGQAICCDGRLSACACGG